MGVPPGDLLNELKSGREIILDDGSLVKPSDVFVVPQDGEKVKFIGNFLSELVTRVNDNQGF